VTDAVVRDGRLQEGDPPDMIGCAGVGRLALLEACGDRPLMDRVAAIWNVEVSGVAQASEETVSHESGAVEPCNVAKGLTQRVSLCSVNIRNVLRLKRGRVLHRFVVVGKSQCQPRKCIGRLDDFVHESIIAQA